MHIQHFRENYWGIVTITNYRSEMLARRTYNNSLEGLTDLIPGERCRENHTFRMITAYCWHYKNDVMSIMKSKSKSD